MLSFSRRVGTNVTTSQLSSSVILSDVLLKLFIILKDLISGTFQ